MKTSPYLLTNQIKMLNLLFKYLKNRSIENLANLQFSEIKRDNECIRPLQSLYIFLIIRPRRCTTVWKFLLP